MGRVCCFAAALVLSLYLGHASPADAFDGMRCKNKLVSEGDAPYRVRSLCGEPDQATVRVEYRTVRQRVPHPALPGRFVEAERTVEVQIEEWIYDFGPHKFVRRVIFEQGRLVRVLSESYGVKTD
jgi:hypothetical protein